MQETIKLARHWPETFRYHETQTSCLYIDEHSSKSLVVQLKNTCGANEGLSGALRCPQVPSGTRDEFVEPNLEDLVDYYEPVGMRNLLSWREHNHHDDFKSE